MDLSLVASWPRMVPPCLVVIMASQKWWRETQQKLVVVDAKTYNEGDQIEDESNGYLPSCCQMKYTATYDSARGDGSNGAFWEHEAGVSMTRQQPSQIRKSWQIPWKGLPEAAMLVWFCPCQNAREGVELPSRVIEEKGSAECGCLCRPKMKLGIWKFFLVTAVSARRINTQFLQAYLGHV